MLVCWPSPPMKSVRLSLSNDPAYIVHICVYVCVCGGVCVSLGECTCASTMHFPFCSSVCVCVCVCVRTRAVHIASLCLVPSAAEHVHSCVHPGSRDATTD